MINRFNLANHGYYFLREVINSGLLHTVSNTNIEIMPKLIDEIKAKGYAIETIDKIDLKNK